MDSNSLSHTKWNCIYHIVFIPKYRRKVMYGQMREDIREIIRQLCEYKKVVILQGNVSVDHIHLCVKIPPKISVTQTMQTVLEPLTDSFAPDKPDAMNSLAFHLIEAGFHCSSAANDISKSDGRDKIKDLLRLIAIASQFGIDLPLYFAVTVAGLQQWEDNFIFFIGRFFQALPFLRLSEASEIDEQNYGLFIGFRTPLEAQLYIEKNVPIFLLSSVMVLLLGYKILPHITPGVTIINKTDKIIYINVTQYAKEVKKAEELTDAELAQLKVHVPIQSQKARYFPASFSALVDSRVMNFHPGWDIGSRASTSNGGSHAFDLSRDKGTCQVDIEIYAELYKIVPKERIYCYKKLLPTLGRMIIHTEEKTIFNDYGPTTDKIEKQLIRFN